MLSIHLILLVTIQSNLIRAKPSPQILENNQPGLLALKSVKLSHLALDEKNEAV